MLIVNGRTKSAKLMIRKVKREGGGGQDPPFQQLEKVLHT
jgi:hypothetical protein